jgi:anti-sigma28 factor (negative regulator of flagellin synthesis)
MKISDQGFTERISSQASRVNSANDGTQGASSSSQQSGSPDLLQLSSIASRIQSAGSGDAAAGRSSRLSQLAQIVNSGAFQIDPSKISSALVSEAVQASSR